MAPPAMTWCRAVSDSGPSRSRTICGAPGKEAVLVRIVGRPHDLVRTDIVGQHGDRTLDRLERDPAIALEQFGRPHLRRGVVKAMVVEMAVHAIEPRRHPAAARFQKGDAQPRMAVDHTTPDHRHCRQHHLHRVADHVARRAVARETVDADGRHRIGLAFMKADRKIQRLGRRPERVVDRIADHLVVVIRVRPQKPAAHAELLFGVAHLGDRQLDRLHRQHRDPEQPLRIGLAIIGEPAVIGAAHRGRHRRVIDRAGEEPEARIEKSGVDAVEIHVLDAGMRIEPALFPLGKFQAVELDCALADADRAEAADPPRIAEQFAVDAHALLAVLVDHHARPALAKRRVHILLPQRERLEDMTIGIDRVVGERHDPSPFGICATRRS